MSSWASYQLQRKRLVTRAEVLKTRVQDFIVFKRPLGHSLKNRMQSGQHKIKCILSLSGQCTDVTINDHSDTQSCQTLQLIIAGFSITLN